MSDNKKGPTSEHEEGSVSDEQMEKSSRSGLDISYKRMSQLMVRDFRITLAKLAQKGFEDEFIWDLVDRAELPDSCAIEKHFKQQVGEKKPKRIAFQMAGTRMMFAYLIQMQKALCRVLRDDEQFLKTVSDIYLEDLNEADNSPASYLLQGYFLGQAGSIHEPENFLDKIDAQQTARMSRAGRGKKGVETSPATTAIKYAIGLRYEAGAAIRHFFENNCNLYEIGIDVDLVYDRFGSHVTHYTFRWQDKNEKGITERTLSKKDVDSRVSQIKRKLKEKSS